MPSSAVSRFSVAPTPQKATAWRDPRTGQPFITVDPGVMGNWTMSRVFAIAHECGHHMRSHTMPQGQWWRRMQFWATRAQELDADCWAARALAAYGYGYLADLQRAARDFAMEGPVHAGELSLRAGKGERGRPLRARILTDRCEQRALRAGVKAESRRSGSERRTPTAASHTRILKCLRMPPEDHHTAVEARNRAAPRLLGG